MPDFEEVVIGLNGFGSLVILNMIIALAVISSGKIGSNGCILRRRQKGFFKGFNRAVKLLKPLICNAQVCKGVGVIWIDLQGFLEGCLGFLLLFQAVVI